MIEYPTVYVTLRGDGFTASRFRTLVSEVSAATPAAASDASLAEELEKALAPPPTKRVVSAAGKGAANAFAAGHGEEVSDGRRYSFMMGM